MSPLMFVVGSWIVNAEVADEEKLDVTTQPCLVSACKLLSAHREVVCLCLRRIAWGEELHDTMLQMTSRSWASPVVSSCSH